MQTVKEKLLFLFTLLYPSYLTQNNVDPSKETERELWKHFINADNKQKKLNLGQGLKFNTKFMNKLFLDLKSPTCSFDNFLKTLSLNKNLSKGISAETNEFIFRGKGEAYSHHGEILQGQYEGNIVVCSLPAPIFSAVAECELKIDAPLTILPNYKTKALKTAMETLQLLGRENLGGIIRVHENNNFPEGKGGGKSTVECAAVAKAIANAIGSKFSHYELGKRILIPSERACDSTIFEGHLVLFRSRTGEVVEVLGEIPPLWVLGFDAMPNKSVDTLAFKLPNYSRNELSIFEALVGILKNAVKEKDLRTIGNMATWSAKINQKYSPKPKFEELINLSKKIGAVGLSVAHTGTLVGLLFEKPDRLADSEIELMRLGFKEPFWTFMTQ